MKTQLCKMKDFTGKIKYYLSIEDFAERRCTLIISEKEYNKLSNYRDWETDRKSTRLNSSHSGESRMPSSA